MIVTDYLYQLRKNGEVIRQVHLPLEYVNMKESVGYFTGKVMHKGADIPVKEEWDLYVGDKEVTVCLRGVELLVLKNARFAGWKPELIKLYEDPTRLVERFEQAGMAFKVKRHRIKGGWNYHLSFKLHQDNYDVDIQQKITEY